MTQNVIEIDVPDGYEISKVDYFKDEQFIKVRLKEKIQRRRIVLEETGEERVINRGEWFMSTHGDLVQWKCNLPTQSVHYLWREVKEIDLSLTNEVPKLSLSADECKEILHEFIKKLASLSGKQ